MGRMERTLDDWIAEVRADLGIDLDVDVRGLLDLARVVAHGVARPAAPLTAFLIGYAAAQQGGGPEAVAEAARRTAVLAERWSAAAGPGEP
ncbi:molybdopterin-guanine dinucleotide biosynthesis protein MobA [Streptomyces kaniharaensis]|uniref:Molybdopterin-guanine dinucleotide biosynthesis protein MobA n=1 Tax=Streptomyces kaniharaensis TaxID=212423 RepID=A0A6N7KUE6_9ACTN|nr:molybdopterin-guanine dinucleotide biosynthesis protein MobA [Streptomyces kaniharaensis]